MPQAQGKLTLTSGQHYHPLAAQVLKNNLARLYTILRCTRAAHLPIVTIV